MVLAPRLQSLWRGCGPQEEGPGSPPAPRALGAPSHHHASALGTCFTMRSPQNPAWTPPPFPISRTSRRWERSSLPVPHLTTCPANGISSCPESAAPAPRELLHPGALTRTSCRHQRLTGLALPCPSRGMNSSKFLGQRGGLHLQTPGLGQGRGGRDEWGE